MSATFPATARIAAMAFALVACRPDQPASSSTAPPAFGGERAAFGESEGERTVPRGVGVCQRVPALDVDPLIDDFEQDSVFIRTTPERHGVWYLANDGSPDGKSEPDSYDVARGGFGGSNHALHYKVAQYGNWGAVAGFQLRYKGPDGIKCPFNASAFGGLAFVVRGSGRVRVRLGTPDTVPTDVDSGRCKQGCWDTHGSLVYLTDDWTEHRLPWSRFAQQGWGTSARLNVAELLDVVFAFGREDQPADMWIDDVRFVSEKEVTEPPPKPVPYVPPPGPTPGEPAEAEPAEEAKASG